MKLTKYAEKRHFDQTPEPDAKVKKKSGKQHLFVIQKHAARQLHYDFRLEMEGVLKSWAVPKGPSLDPSQKRLAVRVEDHPFDYKDFEGVIPEGNYGAGEVIVWDEGVYTTLEAGSFQEEEKILTEALKKGRLEIILFGHKLKGSFSLVKMHRDKEDAWLLVKKQDEYASTEDVTKLEASVKTGHKLKKTTHG